MDDGQEQDQSEERLKEVFNSFDTTGCGSLCPEELTDLCQSLHLDDATPALLQTLLQNQDRLAARVDFEQFKDALILVFSSAIEHPQAEQEALPKPESPEIKPKFVKGSKRYGRRSTPELIAPISDLSEVAHVKPTDAEDCEDNYDSAVPRKRERWNAQEASTEEYEAEGQMHLWNPDEPSTPRGSIVPLSIHLEERLREACEEMAIQWDGFASHTELRAVCEHLGLEVNGDMLLSLSADGMMTVKEFVSRVVKHNKPPTPSASTPYRQLKRHHSTQPFDEGGRRIATPSALTSTIGMRLFSCLDDGTGYTPVEYILDAWNDEGIENSTQILQALNFELDGKLSLSDLTMALENELLITKNGIHQAALASFKAEIRYLLEQVDRELREKEKIRSDLEKAEKQKTQLATEVDEHHSAIERMNNVNLRKLEQDHKEKLAAIKSELMKEMEQIQLQSGLQQEELEAEIEKLREDESFLREHLSISVKENRRLEMELLDSTEKLVEAQSQITQLQTSLDRIMKDKFGELDPGSADFLLQEERIKQLRSGYEAQCRELQDRIDELQSELQEFHSLGRTHQPCNKPLSEELESKSPGMESDPGLGSEEVQPFSMSLEAEMMLEQLKEQHLHEIEELRNQLEIKMNEFDNMVEKQRVNHEAQKAAMAFQHQQEVQDLREEIENIQSHTQDLQSQLEQVELERTTLEQKQTKEREELKNLQEEELVKLRNQLLDTHTLSADLEKQLVTLKAQQSETDENLLTEMEKLRHQHATEIKKLKDEHTELFEARLAEERKEHEKEKAELEKKLVDDWEREKKLLLESHEAELRAKLQDAKLKFEDEREEIMTTLTEQWQKERAQLDEQNNESLQTLLEEEMLRLIREQEQKESKLKQQWESERAQLQEHHEATLLDKILEERSQLQEKFEQRAKSLMEAWEREKLQLEEDYEGMSQDRINEEREKFETEKEELEKRLENLMAEEKARLEESHREAMRELSAKHAEERDALSITLDKLRDDIAQERREIEISFNLRIKEVEDRFLCDQESVAERFQADVWKLEQHYQSELEALTESHAKQKIQWEEQMQKALESAEEQRKMMVKTMEEEKERLNVEWTKEQQQLESVHIKEMEALMKENKQLQNELDELISKAQTKEIELSRQLNELHNRLQESLKTKHELLAQSENKALQTELLLNQTVEDFKQEREELLNNNSELEAKYNEMLSISEKQIMERIELLNDRDDLKMKIEELEMLLKQAAVDFELDRRELQESLWILEQKLKDNVEIDVEELRSERDLFQVRVKELEMEVQQLLASVDKLKDKETNVFMEKMLNNSKCVSLSGEETTQIMPEQASNEEILTEIPYAGDDGAEKMKVFDTTSNEDGPAASDDQGDMQRMGATDNQKQDNQTIRQKEMKETDADEMAEGCCDRVAVVTSYPKQAELNHECCELALCDRPKTESQENKNEEVFPEIQCEPVSPPEAFDYGENKVALELCKEESKPQDVAAMGSESSSQEDEQYHETVVLPSVLEETSDPGELSLEDVDVNCLLNNSPHLDHEHLTAEVKNEKDKCAHDCLEILDQDLDCEQKELSLLKLQALYNTATEENILLHEKISLLQQKTEILENLLAHNNEKIKTGHQVLEENYSLKVRMLLLMEHVKELEIKALKMTDLQISYEDCMCENAKLKEQNSELEKRVWSLESRINIFHSFKDQQISLLDEISRMREENAKLSELFSELERQDEILSAFGLDIEQPESPTVEAFLNLDGELEVKVDAVTDLEDCCKEFEKQNTKLRRTITELQDKSQTLNETTQAHRSEASRLVEENVTLRQKIATLKEEDLKDVQEELMKTWENLKKEKFAAQKAEEKFKKQIAELHLHSQELEDVNGLLSEKNAQNTADMESLRQQLAELIKENERSEVSSSEEKNKNHILEMALHSSGLQNQSKKLYRDEMSRLVEQEKQLLRQENERLQAEVRSIKGDLVQSREKVHQLDATILSLKQLKHQNQSSLVKALEQENTSLKQELEAQRELTMGREGGQRRIELESLQQENEALKAQLARLTTQLLETFQAQFMGLLPPSPHRIPRGQHRGEDPDNMQGVMPEQRAAHADSYRRIGGL